MTWVDYAILAIIGISALISVFRGLIREVLSLVAWACALFVAQTFMHEVSGLFAAHVDLPSARLILAFGSLFVGTLLVAALVNLLVGKLITETGLTGTDRMLGVFFGIGRGVLIVAILVLVAGLTPMPQDPWWQGSVMLPRFQSLAMWMRGYLPAEAAAYFEFGAAPPVAQ
jgi:membrane protein required for colicin V production